MVASLILRRLQNTKILVNEEGKVIYKESYGVLKMTNPKDHVLVMVTL